MLRSRLLYRDGKHGAGTRETSVIPTRNISAIKMQKTSAIKNHKISVRQTQENSVIVMQ